MAAGAFSAAEDTGAFVGSSEQHRLSAELQKPLLCMDPRLLRPMRRMKFPAIVK